MGGLKYFCTEHNRRQRGELLLKSIEFHTGVTARRAGLRLTGVINLKLEKDPVKIYAGILLIYD